jgi:uncharacterized protein YqjF (DUF2071 family)
VTSILNYVIHRPWPLPRGPWVMTQTWSDLLFAHWPVEVAQLRPLVPSLLPIDLYEGSAWVSITPFRVSQIRARFLPPIPPFSSFHELNVRTYVKIENKPGVFFFSLDASSLAAVMGARALYRLPYYHARTFVENADDDIRYSSVRLSGAEADFEARYAPASEPRPSKKGTLEHWLTERYCLYTESGGALFRAEIHHLPWPLQDAKAEIHVNTMADAAGIELPQCDPLLQFSSRLKVFVWPLHRVTAGVYAVERKPASGQVAIKPI